MQELHTNRWVKKWLKKKSGEGKKKRKKSKDKKPSPPNLR